ncbi:chemotaxis protein MotA [Agarivorans sp. Toyoura001]|uniref:flagellar motor protein n=1 Tax=Agarivorans sp. Toyoura001 TaxID=2283141 RepID=UPI0010CF4354|nr:flagellar motor protein [Agarivorans sp. Toyoura001]GDY24185.1 chemotaxis protein MotA [Agarivorans sp. Toyoura001]
MDKLSILGVFTAFSAVGFGHTFAGGNLSDLVNLHAFIIVIGGTVGAVMLQTPASQFTQAIKSIPKVWQSSDLTLNHQFKQILDWSHIVRKDGYLVLEKHQQADAFSLCGLEMLVDGAEPRQLKQSLEDIIDLEQNRLEKQAGVFEAMGGYCPTVGILGAVLGLIQAMDFLTSPEQLGQGIAVAFVATIYGVGFANFVFLPIANKLRAVASERAIYQEMTLAGLVSIAEGASSIEIQRRLSAFSQELT